VRRREWRRKIVRMKSRLSVAAFALLAPAFASANDGLDLATKSKSMAAAASVQAAAPATVAHGKDPLPELLLRAENERRSVGSRCGEGATDLCYDLRDGRVVYRGARQYMPQIEGFKAESVSLRHDGLVLRYSFK
jgi:hypothetical protein